MGFNAPHDPYHKPPNSLITATGLPGTTGHINNNKELYFKASIEALDTEIGRLLQYLSTKNLLDSTNIIFIGDNGTPNDVTKNPVNQQSKGFLYNYGTHVPMFVTGPAVVSPNRRTNELVHVLDIFQTVADLSGVSNSNPNSVALDSRSLLPIIKNQTQNHRGYIYSEQFGKGDTKEGVSIRNQDYHLMRLDSSGEYFFNLTADTFETNNLMLASNLSATDITNYHLLCDSLNALIGSTGCSPLSIADTKRKEIQVYPNPFTEQFYIKNLSQGEIVIRSLIGRKLFHKKIEKSNTAVSLSDFPTGIYILEILDKQKTIVNRQKIIKE